MGSMSSFFDEKGFLHLSSGSDQIQFSGPSLSRNLTGNWLQVGETTVGHDCSVQLGWHTFNKVFVSQSVHTKALLHIHIPGCEEPLTILAVHIPERWPIETCIEDVENLDIDLRLWNSWLRELSLPMNMLFLRAVNFHWIVTLQSGFLGKRVALCLGFVLNLMFFFLARISQSLTISYKSALLIEIRIKLSSYPKQPRKMLLI